MLRRGIALAGLTTVLALTLTLFSSCRRSSTPEQPVTSGFSCGIRAEYGDMIVKGQLERTAAGTLKIDVEEPETIRGLSMEWSGGQNVKLKLHGLSFDVSPDSVPQSAVGSAILGALDSAVSGARDNGQLTENGVLTKGVAAGGEYELLSDPETGALLSLSVPSASLKVEFSGFSQSGKTAAPSASN